MIDVGFLAKNTYINQNVMKKENKVTMTVCL